VAQDRCLGLLVCSLRRLALVLEQY